MPRCAAVPRWVTLRSRTRLRSRAAKRLTQAPRQVPAKRRPRPRKRSKRLLPLPLPSEEESFLYGHAFDVLLALGLVPTSERKDKGDTLEPGVNRMHVMEGECDTHKASEMVAESAPDLVTAKSTDIKLSKEDLSQSEKVPEVSLLPEEAVNSPLTVAPTDVKKESLVNGELKNEEKCEVSESVVAKDRSLDLCEVRVVEEERTKVGQTEGKEDTKETLKEGAEVKEAVGSGGCSEEEDRNSVTSSQSRKRVAASLVETEAEAECEGSSSESDAGVGKRPRLEQDEGEDERERLVREYVEECTESVEEMSRAADKLQREIGALGELLRAKELEWNSVLRLRKLKEEMLERLLRRRRLAALLQENGSAPPDCSIPSDRERPLKQERKVINLNSNGPTSHLMNNGGLMMVPVVSSSPGPLTQYPRGPPGMPRLPHARLQRPILPKPPYHGHPPPPYDNSIVGEGRQGAILDVKSIIADYRSRHPDAVPRRGRRMRHEGPPRPQLEHPVVSSTRISGSPALMSMANMALGSGSHVRENPQGPGYLREDGSRPSSGDSSRGSHGISMDGVTHGQLSFKDALVQFAKLSQPPKPPPPPPPYPEVTLHPVSPPPPHASLLHGILTKQTAQPRATTFSPTLARLLTAPDRSAPTSAPTAHGHFRPPTSAAGAPSPSHTRVNIGEILSSSKKNRNEITITPVSGANKTKDDVVMLGDEDEETDGDRLVIDESRDTAGNGNIDPGTGLPENVPECQGCHQRSAQFVCAGCGNQWYCSRECQVTAWEDHSEMCSG